MMKSGDPLSQTAICGPFSESTQVNVKGGGSFGLDESCSERTPSSPGVLCRGVSVNVHR